MSRTLRFLAAVALTTIAVACGGDDSSSPTVEPTTSAVATTDAATTTAARTTTLPATTTTTELLVPVYPLTGLPVTDPIAAERPALVVKIDNNAAARPQSGLNEADIVFEEIVEVQTRFAIVFQSRGADPVGPIRSGRTQDIQLLGSLNSPLFMWSGGNGNVTRAIEGSDFVNLSAQRNSVYNAAGFFRSNERSNPHDLYASTTAAWTLAPEGASAPAQQFRYRKPGEPAVGDATTGVDLNMDGLPIEWRFDAPSGAYLRSNGGTPHMDEIGGQVSTENVLVMFVDYQPSPADDRSPEAQTIGTGEAWLFTGGVLQRGTWTRTDRLSAIVLHDASGDTIPLTPGRTFVELARVGSANATT
ncbi:MAG: DUF3048 domain-containing protein [Ilumatobacteraceae bacterium]|nr:DUF3048 domain-containing protein [Ilumatobacteraceae bacterium]